jgi:uncharacterized membrane protein YgcG
MLRKFWRKLTGKAPAARPAPDPTTATIIGAAGRSPYGGVLLAQHLSARPSRASAPPAIRRPEATPIVPPPEPTRSDDSFVTGLAAGMLFDALTDSSPSSDTSSSSDSSGGSSFDFGGGGGFDGGGGGSDF